MKLLITGLNWHIGVNDDFWWKSGCFLFEQIWVPLTKICQNHPRDDDGDSPLHSAVRSGRFHVSQYMMENLEEKIQEMTMVKHHSIWLQNMAIWKQYWSQKSKKQSMMDSTSFYCCFWPYGCVQVFLNEKFLSIMLVKCLNIWQLFKALSDFCGILLWRWQHPVVFRH